MKIAIMGGDMRMLIAGKHFAAAGCECIGFGFDNLSESIIPKTDDADFALKDADAVLLPLPCEKEGFLNAPFSDKKIKLSEIFEKSERKALLLGGKVPKGYDNIIDYSVREDFQLFNAVPTAEGAIGIAMKESKKTLNESKAVIVGYGRIGSCLAELLKAFGTEIWVIARSPKSRAQAIIRGHKAVGFENYEAPLSHADMVFNTVPCKVFGKKDLSAMKKCCPLIDLASLPGGAEEAECQEQEIKLIRALGLPGKIAPETAGRIIFETARDVLSERGLNI